MKSTWVCGLLLPCLLCLPWFAHAAQATKPNVIVIMADDQGTVDLGCYGAKDLVTPHLDALASRGIRLTQFYSGAPVCSPARACLLTGRYPVRAGVASNAGSQRGQKAGLPPSEITMAEMFKAAGYATAHIGKWHLGYMPEMMPNAQGFDHSFGHMGGCIDNNGHSTEERAHFGGGSAGPYRGAKFSLFEGGIRVPAIISWPGQLPQGETRGQLAHAADWLPTLAELCEVKPPATKLDGQSLAAVLKSAEVAGLPRAVHWQVGQGRGAQWAVHEGDWKLIGNAWDTGQSDRNQERIPLFLSNLATDPGERTNLAGQHPDLVARLKQLHETHLQTQ